MGNKPELTDKILACIGIEEVVALVAELRKKRKAMTNLSKGDDVLIEDEEYGENEEEGDKDDVNEDPPHKRK